MAALSYLLLPVTGLIALTLGSEPRTRFHGIQAIVFGLVWALGLYGASALSPSMTKIVFGVGGVVWVFLIAATAVGRDPRLPGLGELLQRATEEDLRT